MRRKQTLEAKLAQLIHEHGIIPVERAVRMVQELLEGSPLKLPVPTLPVGKVSGKPASVRPPSDKEA